MAFHDHFSRQAATYAEHRPTYPAALFAWVAALVQRHDCVWDCATGNGQAAAGLADHFASVIATDASAAQLSKAPSHEHVTYRLAPAEASGLPDTSVDLVTVAQALHWFALDAFYGEVRRVLQPAGAIAVWSYGDVRLADPTLDAMVMHYNHETVGADWPGGRELVVGGYRTIPFPFREVPAPPFTIEREWTLPQLAGYVRSWSATNRYAAREGRDPVIALERELAPAWGDPAVRRALHWPLVVRAGYVAAPELAGRGEA